MKVEEGILEKHSMIFDKFHVQRGDQRVSTVARILLAIMWAFVLISLIPAAMGKITWLLYLNFFSYVKLAVTLIKYIPQVFITVVSSFGQKVFQVRFWVENSQIYILVMKCQFRQSPACSGICHKSAASTNILQQIPAISCSYLHSLCLSSNAVICFKTAVDICLIICASISQRMAARCICRRLALTLETIDFCQSMLWSLPEYSGD